MMVLDLFVFSAASDNGMRFVLLALLLVAVVLLLAGATIAVITWRSQRKQQPVEKELT
jgi:flagellar basal body-associated protein FliL